MSGQLPNGWRSIRATLIGHEGVLSEFIKSPQNDDLALSLLREAIRSPFDTTNRE
jgi:hypothetical protein